MNSKRLSEAAAFATLAHNGVYRKGTNIPYVSHVIEAGLIAMTMTDDENVVVAAFLHDIVEDTDYELADIRKRFGDRVAELVAYESEDKMREIPAADSWKIRKVSFLNQLEHAPLEAKIICLADKLSNIRQSAKVYAEKGDDMWLIFNQKDKNEQEWYYRSVYGLISELKDTDAYKEYVSLCDVVFPRTTNTNDGTDKKYYLKSEDELFELSVETGCNHPDYEHKKCDGICSSCKYSIASCTIPEMMILLKRAHVSKEIKCFRS